jgi:hypothetical protein
MHFSPAVVMAARFANESAPAAAAQPFPARVGPFSLYGCVSGATGFKMIATTEAMNVNLCAASCPSTFMAMDAKNCYCGDSLDAAAAPKLALEACGTSALVRRQGDNNNSDGSETNANVMTYSRVDPTTTTTVTTNNNDLSNVNSDNSTVAPIDSDGNGVGNGNGDGDGNGNGNGIGNKGNGVGNTFDNQYITNNINNGEISYASPTTITETLTSTATSVVTCPPEVTDCHPTTTTDVVVITTTYCPEPTPTCYNDECIDYEWYNKQLTCYGGYCSYEYPCEDCEPRRVICEGDYSDNSTVAPIDSDGNGVGNGNGDGDGNGNGNGMRP